MTYLVEAACVLAALVFGASAATKLRSPGAYRRFRAAMAGTGLLPGRLRAALTVGLAGAEMVVALGLAVAAVLLVAGGRFRAVVALLALGLAGVLTCLLIAGVAVLVRRGVLARCACFGATANEPIGAMHLARNVTLLGVVLAGLAGLAGVAGGRAGSGSEPAAAVVMAVVAGGCGALLIIGWEDLAVLVTPVSSVRRSAGPGAG